MQQKNYKRNLNKRKKELPDSVAIKMGCCTSGESAEDRQAAKINNDIKNGMYMLTSDAGYFVPSFWAFLWRKVA